MSGITSRNLGLSQDARIEKNISNILPEEKRDSIVILCIFEIVAGILTIFSNIVFTNLTYQCGNVFHEENKYYAYNHCFANIMAALCILSTAVMQLKISSFLGDIIYWEGFFLYFVIYNFAIHLPFTSSAAMGMDIAFYCHYSIDYYCRLDRKMTKFRIMTVWLLTLLIVLITYRPGNSQRFYLPILPSVLLLLPELIILMSFAYVLRSYFVRTNVQSSSANPAVAEVNRLNQGKKVLLRVFNLVVTSLVFGIGYFAMYTRNATHPFPRYSSRHIALYFTPRLSLLINALFAPWLFCPRWKYKKYFRRIKRWRVVNYAMWKWRHKSMNTKSQTIPQIIQESAVQGIGIVCVTEAWTTHPKRTALFEGVISAIRDRNHVTKKVIERKYSNGLHPPGAINFQENSLENETKVLEAKYSNVVKAGISHFSYNSALFVPYNRPTPNLLRVCPSIVVHDYSNYNLNQPE